MKNILAFIVTLLFSSSSLAYEVRPAPPRVMHAISESSSALDVDAIETPVPKTIMIEKTSFTFECTAQLSAHIRKPPPKDGWISTEDGIEKTVKLGRVQPYKSEFDVVNSGHASFKFKLGKKTHEFEFSFHGPFDEVDTITLSLQHLKEFNKKDGRKYASVKEISEVSFDTKQALPGSFTLKTLLGKEDKKHWGSVEVNCKNPEKRVHQVPSYGA